ncbi:Prefoldin subunit 6 [Elasticomyces elasticus]|uniref:Prefoldin subunit 6 n=1 Tax=Exophiala sideris TaxID=1016849 RepID=A0ABR0JC75_9EURO|nr:Prefoldin subunit 6 [Elasticomyces elasticus]KAK5031148.1 Prefoldin subunit 6 [Exophiala sideris]KAK5038869.1 Prefoldin subunit 6 [Exophiala sideris]KAK5060753.1 Prefoldin subunit 6 [Exophiala sideris]KAK5183665.1 Prefoldin subunit 6 [Eurotiomycetes sp. CCFEE 6388]
MEDDRNKLQSLSEALQKLQDDLQGAVEARQKLEAQQQENKAVQKEFTSLVDDAGIYKLVGPVLLKQDKTEAVSAVEGRLDFIGKEITRTEARIKELQESSEKKRVDLLQLQQKLQMAGQEQLEASG